MKSGATGAEQHRRNLGISEYCTIGPETRAARSAVMAAAADCLNCCRKQRRQLMACGDFIRGSAEQWTSRRTERRILVDKATHDVLHFVVSLRPGKIGRASCREGV